MLYDCNGYFVWSQVVFSFSAKKHFGTFPRGFESTSHPPTVDGPGESQNDNNVLWFSWSKIVLHSVSLSQSGNSVL